jgi:hypothetical protein
VDVLCFGNGFIKDEDMVLTDAEMTCLYMVL